MTTKTLLLHGYAGKDLSFWLQWLETELKNRDKEVIFPEYKNSKHPQMQEWTATFKNALSDPDCTYTFIAHSMGCLVTLKLIEIHDIKINKVVLVACPKNEVQDDDQGSLWQKISGKERDDLKTFFEQNLNWELIKAKIPELHLFFSKDDFAVPFEAYEYYQNKFPDAHYKIFDNYGHFNRKNNVYKLPEVLEILAK